MSTARCPALSSKFAVSKGMLVLFFLFKANFGQWFCHCKVSMYVTSDPKFASFTGFKLLQSMLKSMKICLQSHKQFLSRVNDAGEF